MSTRVTCGDGGCRMPGAVRRYGGQHTNGGCRCRAEDIAAAHEEIAAALRGSPAAARELRRERQEHEHMSELLERLMRWAHSRDTGMQPEPGARDTYEEGMRAAQRIVARMLGVAP